MNNGYDTNNTTNIFNDMSLYDAELKLKELGVNVQDSCGNYRYLSEILDDVSKVWRRVGNPSLSRKICDASQCLIKSYKTSEQHEQENVVLDDFLSQFVRSGVNAC